MNHQFVDIPTRAKDLGVTNETLRARILSEDIPCFVYVAQAAGKCEQDDYLPAYDRDRFTFVRWRDHGSDIDHFSRDFGTPRPEYTISGWLALDPYALELVLATGERPVSGTWAWVLDRDLAAIASIELSAPDKEVWVDAPGEPSGGHLRYERPRFLRSELFLCVPEDATGSASNLGSRKEGSYLNIIAAMLTLFRRDPVLKIETALIEHLLSISQAQGLSERNLQKVFAAAKRQAPQNGN